MTVKLVAALDQGTTSTRCMLFDRQGRMVSIAQREHQQYYPHPGWVEHDAAEIWSIVRRIIPQALADAGVGAAEVVALGVTNQRETAVLWNRHTGVPVGRAIVWQDTRTTDVLADLATRIDPARVLARTGLPMANYFSAAKLRWMLDRPRLHGAFVDTKVNPVTLSDYTKADGWRGPDVTFGWIQGRALEAIDAAKDAGRS